MADGVKLSTVQDLLAAEAWQSAADLAALALTQGKWKRHEEAYLYYARTRALSNLDRYSEALEPGQRAVAAAEQAKAWDLLGLCLVELAWVQRKIEGLQVQALETINRYFANFKRYGAEGRSRYLPAMHAKGICLRFTGRHTEALDHLLKTYADARNRRDSHWADLARGNAIDEALLLRNIPLAESLIDEGKDLAKRRQDAEAVVSNLVDQAHVALLKGNLEDARGKAQEAIVQADQFPGLSAQAFDLLHRAARSENKNLAALSTAILAKIQAEEDHRPDLIAELGNSIQEIILRDPEVAEQFIRGLTRSAS